MQSSQKTLDTKKCVALHSDSETHRLKPPVLLLHSFQAYRMQGWPWLWLKRVWHTRCLLVDGEYSTTSGLKEGVDSRPSVSIRARNASCTVYQSRDTLRSRAHGCLQLVFLGSNIYLVHRNMETKICQIDTLSICHLSPIVARKRSLLIKRRCKQIMKS